MDLLKVALTCLLVAQCHGQDTKKQSSFDQILKEFGFSASIQQNIDQRDSDISSNVIPDTAFKQLSPAAPVQRRPVPVQQRPASIQQRPVPVQQRPAPVQQRPAPVQQRPAPVQQRPVPSQQRPAQQSSAQLPSLDIGLSLQALRNQQQGNPPPRNRPPSPPRNSR